MPVQFRQYTVIPGITKDYALVRDFFVKCKSAIFTYARWDWMALHGYLAITSAASACGSKTALSLHWQLSIVSRERLPSYPSGI